VFTLDEPHTLALALESMKSVVALFAGVLGSQLVADGRRMWGTLPFDSGFVHFAGKFCYDFAKDMHTQAGKFQIEMSGVALERPLPAGQPAPNVNEGSPCWGPCNPYGGLYIVVYDDEKAHWREAEKTWAELTCQERLQYASWAERVEMTDDRPFFNRTIDIYEHIRPRFWYFNFVDCGIQPGWPSLTYSIHAWNLLQGQQEEFGADERGMLALQLWCAILFGGLAFFLRASTSLGVGGEAFRIRPLLRLLFYSSTLACGGCSFLGFHYAVYAINGYGVDVIEVCGMVSSIASKALLTILQLLVAKGWVLFYAPEEINFRRFTLLTIGLIILMSAWCEIRAQYFHDWRTTLYLYESEPGEIVLLLNTVLFIEAGRSMYYTYRQEAAAEVREFYRMVFGALFLYFLALPVTFILAELFSPWVRAKYIARVEALSRFGTMLILACCLRPSRLDLMINARLEEGLDSIECMSDQEFENERRGKRHTDDEASQRLQLMEPSDNETE